MKSSTSPTPTKSEGFLIRFLLALPLLVLFIFARAVLQANVSHYLPLLEEAAKTGWINDGGNLVPLRTTYSGIEGIDSFLAIFVGFFTPALAGLDHSSIPGGESDMLYAPQRLQSITFLADYTVLTAILTLESHRPGNARTLAAFPTIFLLAAQLLGGGQITPLIYFLTYTTQPLTHLSTPTKRLIPGKRARTLLPALLVGYVIPATLFFFSTPLSTQQAWNAVWQLFPLWILLLHFLFSLSSTSAPAKQDKALPALRIVYALLFLLAAATYVSTLLLSPVPFPQLFVADLSLWEWDAAVQSVSHGTAMFLKWDEIFIVLATTYWMVLHVRELKREGWTDRSWMAILEVFGAVSVGLGPGAAMAGLWWWREEVLAAVDGGKRE